MPFVLTTLGSFGSSLVFYLLTVKTVDYSTATFGVSYGLAGLSVSATVLSGLVTRIFLGHKVDAWGFKRSMTIGLGITAVVSVLYLVQAGFAMFMVVRVLHGVGMAISTAALMATAAYIVPKERKGEGIGYYTMSIALSTGIGPFAAVMLAEVDSTYRALFMFVAVVGVLTFICSLFIRVPKVVPESKDGITEKVKHRISIGTLIQVSVVPLVIVICLVFLCYSGVMTFITGVSEERGLTAAASVYFIVYSIVVLISRPPAGRVIDRKGENGVIYSSLASLVVGLVVLAFARNSVVLLISAALIGYGIGITQSTIQTIVAKSVPPTELGRANSTVFMGLDVGSGVGPVLLGSIIPFVGYQAIYIGLAVLAVFATILYFFVHGRKVSAQRRSPQ